MKKLWDKGKKLDAFVEAFETKDDLLLDQQLVPYDIYGTLAHAAMLMKVKILTPLEFAKAQKGLGEILVLHEKGRFFLKMGDEDIHTKIENYLTEYYGEIGKKIHTGRSRNDQVLTMLRLFVKDKGIAVKENLLELIASLTVFVKEYGAIPMPGYTHMQKAMPSTVGLWVESFIQSLLDDYFFVDQTLTLTDQSPLGSGAGYGISLPLDRSYTASLLGFKKVQSNSLYCQNSRSKFDAAIIGAILQIGMTINKFASDIMLFTTCEYNFFTVSDSLCSGSSIMPQKKNVDIAELLRSKVHILLGFYSQIMSLSTNLPSGYNRDVQDTKEALLKSFLLTNSSLQAATLVIKNFEPNEKVLQLAMTHDLYAADAAYELVQKGIPFRTAYQQIAKNISSLEKKIMKKNHDMRTVLGYEKQIKKEFGKLEDIKQAMQKRYDFLLRGGELI